MSKKELLFHPGNYNTELAKKFKDAAHKKISVEDFIKEFLIQFLSNDTKTAYLKDLTFFFDFLKMIELY